MRKSMPWNKSAQNTFKRSHDVIGPDVEATSVSMTSMPGKHRRTSPSTRAPSLCAQRLTSRRLRLRPSRIHLLPLNQQFFASGTQDLKCAPCLVHAKPSMLVIFDGRQIRSAKSFRSRRARVVVRCSQPPAEDREPTSAKQSARPSLAPPFASPVSSQTPFPATNSHSPQRSNDIHTRLGSATTGKPALATSTRFKPLLHSTITSRMPVTASFLFWMTRCYVLQL